MTVDTVKVGRRKNEEWWSGTGKQWGRGKSLGENVNKSQKIVRVRDR